MGTALLGETDKLRIADKLHVGGDLRDHAEETCDVCALNNIDVLHATKREVTDELGNHRRVVWKSYLP